MEKSYNLVYKTTNLLTGKFYIGVHSTNNINDGYLGSGYALKESIKKYGKDIFSREILFDFKTLSEAYYKEGELVTREIVESRETYNLCSGGTGGIPLNPTPSKNVITKKGWVKKEDFPSSDVEGIASGMV